MNLYGFLKAPPNLLFRLASCDTSWKIRNVGSETTPSLFDNDCIRAAFH